MFVFGEPSCQERDEGDAWMPTHQSLQDTQPVPELGELPGDGTSPPLLALCSLPDSDGQGTCGQCSRGNRELTTLTHSILCVQKSLRMVLIAWVLGKSVTRAPRAPRAPHASPCSPFLSSTTPKSSGQQACVTTFQCSF